MSGHRSIESIDGNPLGIGTTRLKSEGKVAHPEDIYTHCGCELCERRWQEQLAAYNASVIETKDSR